MVFYFASLLFRRILFKVLLASMKTLTNYGDFTESRMRTIYRITGGSLYAATSNMKRVSGRIFTISKCFHKSKPKLNLL
jgi:hypothetical protein